MFGGVLAAPEGRTSLAVAVAEVVAVSVERKQSSLDSEYTERREKADLAELFRAHRSTAYHNLVLLHTGLGHDPDERVNRRDGWPESPPSLDTCEQLSRQDQNPTTPDEFAQQELASQAAEALRASISRSRRRQKIVTELILAGEVAHAERLARCMTQSVQLECPVMAGGCGCDDNYTPITCDSRLCAPCMNRAMGRNIDKYLGRVEAMDNPTLLTLTIENVDDLKAGKEAVQDAFGRLRQRTIPASGEVTRESSDDEDDELVTKRWVWKTGDDGGEPADHYWKSALCGAGAFEVARRVQDRYVDEGRQIPWKELVDGGVYGIDILQTDDDEDGRYNVHIHVVCEMPYIPQAALSSVWEDLTGAPVVDVRRIEKRGEFDSESALSEVLGYVTKPPEFESIEEEVKYLTALKGSRLVQPFGSLHGNTPLMTGALLCSSCERAPRWWNYKGVVDECYDNMEVAGSSSDGDRPPPESSHVESDA